MMEYQSSIADLDEVTKQLQVSFKALLVDERVQKRLGTIQKTAKIRGFRPGKAPMSLLKSMHEKSEREHILRQLVEESLGKIVSEKSLQVVGQPTIDIESTGESGEDVQYKVTLSLYPAPALDFDREFKVEIPALQDEAVALEEALQHLRKAQAKTLPVLDRQEVQADDVVSISFCEVGKEVEKHSHKFVVGASEVPKELEDAVIGKRIGENFEVSLPSADGAVQTAYNVKVTEIGLLELPELDDEFAKGTSIGAEDVASLKERLLTMFRSQMLSVRDESVESEIVKILGSEFEFAIPEVMIDQQIRFMFRSDLESFTRVFADLPEERQEELRKVAEEQVRSSIVLNVFADQNDIQVSKDAEDAELAAHFRIEREKAEEVPAGHRYRLAANERIRQRLALAMLRDRAIVTEKPAETVETSEA